MAFIESALDDPEHYSVDGFSDELKDQVEVIINQLNEIIRISDSCCVNDIQRNPFNLNRFF